MCLQIRFLLQKSLKLKLRNKLLTAGEIFIPIYAILFMLLIYRLDVIPFEVVYTPAAEAPPRHSIFAPAAPPTRKLSEQEQKDVDEMKEKFQMDKDPIRLGVAPKNGKHAKRVADALCAFLALGEVQPTFGDGTPCKGVEMFANGAELYKAKSRFDKAGSGLDFGFIIDEERRNWTLVHHEFLLMNATSAAQEEGMAVQSQLVTYQSLITAVLAGGGFDPSLTSGYTLVPSPGSAPRIAAYLQEFPTAEKTVILNFLKWNHIRDSIRTN